VGTDLADFLQHAQEIFRVEQSLVRVLPADQDFDGMNTSVLKVELRLVMEDELAPLLRIVQIGLELQPFLGHGRKPIARGATWTDPQVRAISSTDMRVVSMTGRAWRLNSRSAAASSSRHCCRLA
jgi:hypothetical protein